MKKWLGFICTAVLLLLLNVLPVAAQVGDMGFFGGITEGVRLPKTTEVLLAQNASSSANMQLELAYKEVIFLSGEPVTFEGTINVRPSGSVTDKDSSGSYRVIYTVRGTDTASDDARIARTVTFTVNWRRQNNQVVKDYVATAWTETITAGGQTFTLDWRQSHFDVSILESRSAGVTYYAGDMSMKAVYRGDSATSHEVAGTIYGYTSAWSHSEVQRLDGRVYTAAWDMQYQVRPSVSVEKALQYSPNEPMAISFPGNYREVMANQSGLQYDITVQPTRFNHVAKTGGASISTYNTFEQLIAPDVSYLKGNFAEADISKLFAMEVLDGDPKFFQPNQQITRGQYVTMLVKALKLPIDTSYQQTSNSRTNKKVAVNVVFPDVMPERADYPYVMAAYTAGLAVGRGNGHFYVDSPIEREEAYVLLVRALGLSSLGPEPTPMTPFSDDASISAWAKKDLYAASRIGLLTGDLQGRVLPHTKISKAEAAAMVNRLVEYMRTGLRNDYSEYIVNY